MIENLMSEKWRLGRAWKVKALMLNVVKEPMTGCINRVSGSEQRARNMSFAALILMGVSRPNLPLSKPEKSVSPNTSDKSSDKIYSCVEVEEGL